MTVPDLTNLRRVREHRSDAGSWLVAAAFHFEEAVLHIERVSATDEIVLQVGPERVLEEEEPGVWRDVSAEALWQPLLGADASYWWTMTNQRGYHDGVQVEFASVGGGTSTRLQWIAEGAYLRPAVVGGQTM
jgi:hypothetical protein